LNKLCVLILTLINISIVSAKDSDRDLQLDQIIFDKLTPALSSTDDVLFEQYALRQFIPDYPDVFACGITGFDYKPRPHIKYTISFQKTIESWIPLFDNHKTTTYWLVAL